MAPSSSFIPGSQARAFVAKAIKAKPAQRFPKRFFYGVMLFVSQREPHPDPPAGAPDRRDWGLQPVMRAISGCITTRAR